MARTITEIFQDKMNQIAADATLGALLTSTSKVAVYRLLLYISAVCDWTLEKLQDIFKKEVNDTIAAMKPHSLQWYAGMAKAFQYGYNLVVESDYYDNAALTQQQIDESKIIDYAAVIEQQTDDKIRLRIKVATDNGADLEPLSQQQLDAFKAYMARIKDAGVVLSITSTVADKLKASVRIKYNPLVINSNGGRIDGTSTTPVQDALRAFLKNLPFNGVFSVAKMVDALQAVDGVEDVKVDLVQRQYGLLPFTAIDIDYTPDSGYLRIDNADLMIQFIAA